MVTTKGGKIKEFFEDMVVIIIIALITPIMLLLGIVSAISGHNLVPEL